MYKSGDEISKSLLAGTPNKEIIPLSWKESNGVYIGKRGKVHTVVCSVDVPQVKAEYIRRVIDPKTGQDIRPRQEGECHSWNRNHYNHFCSAIGGINAADATNFIDGNINGKDTGGTVRSGAFPFTLDAYGFSGPKDAYGASPDVAISTHGIQLGTGVGAESFDGHVIGTQIAHGLGAGQLYYATTPPLAYAYADNKLSYIRYRYFDNFSGAQISPTEMTMVGRIAINNVYYYVMLSRDIISPALDIPHLAQAAIQYKYTLDFSSPVALRNLYNMIFNQGAMTCPKDSTFGDGKISATDTDGVVRYLDRSGYGWIKTPSVHNSTYGYARVANSSTSGVQAGTDDAAVNFDDYVLPGLITHGTGEGELSYDATETPVKSWVDPVMTIAQARTLSNGSGGTIGVKTSGIVGRPQVGSPMYNILMARNVFSTVNVADGESIRIVYLFKITYPAVRA